MDDRNYTRQLIRDAVKNGYTKSAEIEKSGFWPALLALLGLVGGGAYVGHKLSKDEPGDATAVGGAGGGSGGGLAPVLTGAGVPLGLAGAGWLLSKILSKKKEEKLKLPKRMVVDVPMYKESQDAPAQKPWGFQDILDSPADFFPMFLLGSSALPIGYHIIEALKGGKKEQQKKIIQQKLEQLQHIGLPYGGEAEKFAEEDVDKMLDLFFEKKSDFLGIGDLFKGVTEKGIPAFGGLLGLLAGGGYVGGKLLSEHLTYDPVIEKMMAEEEYGDILGPLKDIPIELRPVYLGMKEKEKKKRQQLLQRTSQSLPEDIDISEILQQV
jgi:hypothetical protein